MSKYQDLEGIVSLCCFQWCYYKSNIIQDLEEPEVYETSDTEETWHVEQEAPKRRDSISEEAFDTGKSIARFEREKVWLDPHVTDFSDRVDRVAGYETASDKETMQNMMMRLRSELSQLEDMVESEGTLDQEKELKALQETLSRINLKTKDKKLISPEIMTGIPSIDTSASTSQLNQSIVTNPEEVIILDKRLTRLEKLLGTDFAIDKSLQSIVNDLFRKFKLLSNDTDQLGYISRAIDEVNTKFEKSIAMRRAVNIEADVPEETQVHEVYTVFQKTRQVQDDLPFIIKRLETLADLHTRVATSVVSVESLEEQIDTLSKDVDAWETSLGKLETKLEEMNNAFEENKKQIMEKIETK
ncbi:CYFA0S03e05842g1_1 [Cyberlindnera fabianii]|uniref:CYFA0S03e05842g1_1 n=1 Tax=Cyberlindnera fabianii TaxID=36022 RepID=A0A061AW92_CYBFA|nr:CYFA0S03e05842g1_1 [Cyberlindnera fabianii]